tara:strand:- start:619 stop:1566 length:948 start_codon:yes stop_codon:yes gene_type:complete
MVSLKKTKKKNIIKSLILNEIMTNEQIASKEGDYFTKKDFKYIITEDCDVFCIKNKKRVLLARFRKNVIPHKLSKIALDELEESAKKKHDNRGAAGGELDLNKLPKYVNQNNMYKRSKYVIRGYESLKTGKMVEQIIGNQVSSNIIGYYDKPDRNLGKGAPPCRLTQFNKNNMEKFKRVIPFLKEINKQFRLLVPKRYRKQRRRANKTNFVIDKTAFSTITINHNWRTALHKDSGDFKDGFGNLVVCSKGKYTGGFTGFPQYGIAFDVRQGDFLAMDVHEWHCNTEIKGKGDFSRMSVVCYLREKMLRCEGLKIS